MDGLLAAAFAAADADVDADLAGKLAGFTELVQGFAGFVGVEGL